MKHLLAAVVAVLGFSYAFAAEPNTWYASAANYGKDGLDGKSPETAWGTLQDAHDNASAGDTIRVLPGYYEQGCKYDSGSAHTNRLLVTKKLFFEATGSRDETHIVGRIATVKSGGKASTDGRGADGMRCICVTDKATGSMFTGFTIRDGSSGDSGSDAYNESGKSAVGGGAINCYGKIETAWTRAYFVDCVISNSVASWGGAMYGGTAIRCLIINNTGSSYGGICCSAGLWNSVVIGTKTLTDARPACGNNCRCVNTLIAATESTGYNRYGACYNTLFTSIGGTAMGTTSSPTYKNCANTASGVFSPATGDYRPVAGREADGTGLSLYLTNALALPAGIEMKDFNGNPIDLTKPTCDIGPVQGAVEADFGHVIVPTETIVNGVRAPRFKTTYARSGTWPAPVVVAPSVTNLYCYGADLGFTRRFLRADGTLPVIPPAAYGSAVTLSNVLRTHEYWCDPTADAKAATGAEEAPFRTIQSAIVAATNDLAGVSGGAAVIHLKPGDYHEGCAYAYSATNRFVLPAGNAILLKSTDGAAVTTIRGAADPNPPYACYAGCGPAAMRCGVFLGNTADGACAVQGVTLADGHSNAADPTTDKVSDRGGCIYASQSLYAQLLDCVVTNCTALRGGATFYGSCVRCRLYDCVAYGGVFRYGYQVGCYVDPSCRLGTGAAGAPASGVFSTDSKPILCTAPQTTISGMEAAAGCLFGDYGTVPACAYYGSVMSTADSIASKATGCAVQDPFFVDPDSRDYRVLTRTPAAAASLKALGGKGGSLRTTWAEYIANYVQGDVDGNALTTVGDAVVPGCFQTTVDGVAVAAAKGSIAVEGGKLGFNALGPEGSITVTMANGTRPCPGLVVNGVTNLFDTGTIRFTAADVAAQDGSILAEAFYTKDWYANPAGDDDNAGFTPKSAKRTLSAATACAASGDTVHAAPGRYAEGESRKAGTAHPPERVYVPGGVTLVGDEGASKTFIVGQLGTDEYTDTLGCGSNSMRCVTMAKSSVIRGFTLTDGSAYPANGQDYTYGAPYNHGAVQASERHTTFVCDCVVTNCRAYQAAAGREVTFVNTLITGNRAKIGVTSETSLIGCVMDGNYADTASAYRFTYAYDTTFGPHAYKLNGTAGTALGSSSTAAAARLVNCLVLGPCSTGKLTNPIWNCVFAKTWDKTDPSILNNASNCLVVAADRLQVDGDLRPVAGKNDACDFADDTLVTPNATVNKYLTPLRVRANNGCRLDAGALEADWRGRYAEDILGRRFAVGSADKMVEETESRSVLVPEGTSLVGAILNRSARETPYLLKFVVPKDGSLTVTVDGLVTDYTAGTYEVTVNATAATLPVTFASTAGTAEIFRGKSLAGALLIVR